MPETKMVLCSGCGGYFYVPKDEKPTEKGWLCSDCGGDEHPPF